MSSRQSARVFLGVTLLLFTAGWAANHFSSVLVLIRDQEGVSSVMVNAAFGIYALGMLPCLLIGGMLADRWGPRFVVLTGGVLSALGNLMLLFLHEGLLILLGRFIVGTGVGLVVSAGTAWAGRLRGGSGVTLAGIILTLGFAIGPIVASAVGVMTHSVELLFALSVSLSALAVVVGLLLGDAPRVPISGGTETIKAPARSLRKALAVSLPMAIWVFSCITTSIVILSARAADNFNSPILLPAISSALAFSAGLIAQYLGRKFAWGRQSGTAGALFATAGYGLAAFGGETISVPMFVITAVLLGTAYGLCLREGLLGINTYTPVEKHGTGIGIYYVFTYFGFAFPVLFDVITPHVGYAAPLIVIAVLAFASA
ncbi:MAG: MFS transporter, partial [Corynebacterium casei]|nr:MFS transporter [Corynebacterium casei]